MNNKCNDLGCEDIKLRKNQIVTESSNCSPNPNLVSLMDTIQCWIDEGKLILPKSTLSLQDNEDGTADVIHNGESIGTVLTEHQETTFTLQDNEDGTADVIFNGESIGTVLIESEDHTLVLQDNGDGTSNVVFNGTNIGTVLTEDVDLSYESTDGSVEFEAVTNEEGDIIGYDLALNCEAVKGCVSVVTTVPKLKSTPTYGEKNDGTIPISVSNTDSGTEVTSGPARYVFTDALGEVLGEITGDLSDTNIQNWSGPAEIIDNITGTPQNIIFDYGKSLSKFPVNSEDITITTYFTSGTEESSNSDNNDVECLEPDTFLFKPVPVESSRVATITQANRPYFEVGQGLFSEFNFTLGRETGVITTEPATAIVKGYRGFEEEGLIFLANGLEELDNPNAIIQRGEVGHLKFEFDTQQSGLELDLFFDNTGVGIDNTMVDSNLTGFTNVDGTFEATMYPDGTYDKVESTENDHTGRANFLGNFSTLEFDVFKPTNLTSAYQGMRFVNCNNTFKASTSSPRLAS